MTVEMIGMSVFGLLVLGVLVLAVRQGAQQRAHLATYSASRGWSVAHQADARLSAILEQAMPQERWYVFNVMQVEQAPESVYLFRYQVSSRNRSSGRSSGTACLAEHTGRWRAEPVEIFPRTPGVEKLVGDRVDAGGEEFRDTFTVVCQRPEEGLAVVNPEVERLLLEHRAGRGWYLTATVSRRLVLVSSFWAETGDDWDYLIRLAKGMREAVR